MPESGILSGEGVTPAAGFAIQDGNPVIMREERGGYENRVENRVPMIHLY